MSGEFFDLRSVPGFRFPQNNIELLNFGPVASNEFLWRAPELLHLLFMPGFSLRKKLAIEMLDLRKSVWNEDI